MASIPASVIMIWTGSNATIPSGWSRETTLDDKHAKAWGAENPNATGGATTHTHTSATHTHTLDAHTHTYSLNEANTEDSAISNSDGSGAFSGPSHSHTGTSGAQSGGTTSTDAVTYGAVSNDPPYRKVIFVKAAAGAQLATNMVAFYNSNTPPSNWSNVSELQGRYLKGAGTGADADLTTDNGSATNVHGIVSNHTGSHSHSAAASGTASGLQTAGGGGNEAAQNTHSHNVTLASVSTTVTEYSGNLTTAETVEPVYVILQAIKKGASGIKTVGIIGLWLGTVANIPKGWIVCDGTNSTKDLRDKFIKIGDPAGANGGTNTHTHAAQAHAHTSASHTHTGTAAGANQVTGVNTPGSHHFLMASSTHTVSSISSVNAAWGNANTTADSSANQPSYRTTAYIQFQKEISNGNFLLSLM